jgi:hypothetical protein
MCTYMLLTLLGTPTTNRRKRKIESHIPSSPQKARKLLMTAFDETSTKLDDFIKGDSFSMPEIPAGYNAPIFAFPVQLRQRNAGGAAIVAGAAAYIAPPIAKNDIGRMEIICQYCRARKFAGETDGMQE